MFSKIFGMFTTDVGIDLGTANTVVFLKEQGIVLREPTVVAVKAGTAEVLAVGDDAKRMLGRTPGAINAIRPLKDGVITDFEITETMLKYFIDKVNPRRGTSKIRVVIAVPSAITEIEKRAVKDAALAAGAREVYLIEEPMAAAVGIGLPIMDAKANMVVDIGGGTTEVAVISLSGIVQSRSVRIAGDEFDAAIIDYLKRGYGLLIGESTAEDVKIRIGSAFPMEQESVMEVKGRDLVSGMPKTNTISSTEVREAMSTPLAAVVDAVKVTLERCPPELAGDLLERGIVLAGGGALMNGIDLLLAEETGLPVVVAEDPLSAVAEGAGKVLGELGFLRKIGNSNSSSAEE